MEKIERVKRELVHKGAILDIYEDTVRLPNGKEENHFNSNTNIVLNNTHHSKKSQITVNTG